MIVIFFLVEIFSILLVISSITLFVYIRKDRFFAIKYMSVVCNIVFLVDKLKYQLLGTTKDLT